MAIIFFILILTASIIVAIISKRRAGAQNIKDYLTASRSFGSIFIFFLGIGETYSIGMMTAFPGGIYHSGYPFASWFLSYVLLAYPVGYFLTPRIWQLARNTNAATVPDIFRKVFNSRALEITVAFNIILFMIPWATIQFSGLTLVLSGLNIVSSRWLLMLTAGGIVFLYIAISGIRASAYVSVMKDLLVLFIIGTIVMALLKTDNPATLFQIGTDELHNTGISGRQESFAMSTMFFQAIGLPIFPLSCAYLMTARSARTVMRAQIFMPLYMVIFPFMMLIAFYAKYHHLTLTSPNDAFIETVKTLLPPAMIGIVAGGAALSALVVLSGTCLVIGSLVARNLVPGLPENHQKTTSQMVIMLYIVVSMILATMVPTLVSHLYNMTYFGVTQLLPCFLLAILSIRARPRALCAGIILGDAVGCGLYLSGIDTLGINPGLIGLVANTAIVFLAGNCQRPQKVRHHAEQEYIVIKENWTDRPLSTSSGS